MANQTIAAQPQRRPIEQVIRPFQRFAHIEGASGIILIIGTLVALIWANSPWSNSYLQLWQTKLTFQVAGFGLSKELLLWVNDGLMAVFFFLVGLEIKREILVGELSSPRKAALPIAAALGGMVVPVLIYMALNAGKETVVGWGVPMATDIAFALGILALVGRRAPLSLKVFLTALAIVDDLGAVLVIAVFYTAKISWVSLIVGIAFLVLAAIANWSGVRQSLVYALLGIVVWVAFLKSGVHATIAGVLLSMTIPVRTMMNAEQFLQRGRALLDRFERGGECTDCTLLTIDQRAVVQALETACERVESPLQRLEHALHPWVAYLIMPIFALANAGVDLRGDLLGSLTGSISLGIAAGLILGKQLGITLFSWLAVKLGWAALPEGVTWRHIYGAGWLAGIGFTMSVFIAGLAFGYTPELGMAKIGILLASLIAGVTGWLILRGGKGAGDAIS